MVIGKNIVPFITEFVTELDQAIAEQKAQKRLSKTQKYWLAFCLMGILVTSRSRNRSCPRPPPQIPACAINALGSLPRVLTAKRMFG